MSQHDLVNIIANADTAINAEDFDEIMTTATTGPRCRRRGSRSRSPSAASD
jgi:hypothetical protein